MITVSANRPGSRPMPPAGQNGQVFQVFNSYPPPQQQPGYYNGPRYPGYYGNQPGSYGPPPQPGYYAPPPPGGYYGNGIFDYLRQKQFAYQYSSFQFSFALH